MTIKYEADCNNFGFWAGAIDTVNELTEGELMSAWTWYEENCEDEPVDATAVNDFFWFERDFIAELCGYNDWDSMVADSDRRHGRE